MSGKDTCRTLKQIRKQIADANGIPFEVTECTYEGECSGTCPKCEAELRELDAALEEKRKNGEEVRIPDISIPGAGVGPDGSALPEGFRPEEPLRGKINMPPDKELRGDVPKPEPEPLRGQIKPPPERPMRREPEPAGEPEPLMGKLPEPPETPWEDGHEPLMGEVCAPGDFPEDEPWQTDLYPETEPQLTGDLPEPEPPEKPSFFKRIFAFFRRKK